MSLGLTVRALRVASVEAWAWAGRGYAVRLTAIASRINAAAAAALNSLLGLLGSLFIFLVTGAVFEKSRLQDSGQGLGLRSRVQGRPGYQPWGWRRFRLLAHLEPSGGTPGGSARPWRRMFSAALTSGSSVWPWAVHRKVFRLSWSRFPRVRLV